MTFNSLQFVAFFAVVLLLYYRLGVKGQNRLVVIAGAVFYGVFDWRFLGLLWFSILVDFFVGRALEQSDDARTRKLLLGISLVSQLGILGFFKYFNFFMDSAARALELLGFNVSLPSLALILPIGISFYTFQTLAYVFFVHRGRMPAERNLVTFAAFVSWFPQMVAGPIERPTSLLPQVQQRRDVPSWPMIEAGAGLFLQGLLKKVVVADSLAPFVGRVFAAPEAFGWPVLLAAAVGFSLQVYGDFSGYSDMARGVSRILGVELRRNFEQPFLSRNIQELWQRWHTSLSWWFLEFVGRPLGRLRRGPAWSAVTMLAVFALIGLWHGAAGVFIVWGVLNGVLVVLWRRRPIPDSQDPDRVRVREAPRILLTFGMFCLGAIFFRAGSMPVALTMLGRILTLQGGSGVGADAAWVLVMLGLMLAVDVAERNRRVAAIEVRGARSALGGVATPPEAVAESLVASAPVHRAGVMVGLVLVAVIVFSGGTPTPFIYFQF